MSLTEQWGPTIKRAGDRWMYNFVGGIAQKNLMIEVIAAENNGWRAGMGITEGGKVIEKAWFKSQWFKDFEAAVKQAKSWARIFKIPWRPMPYSTAKPHKPGTPPPEGF